MQIRIKPLSVVQIPPPTPHPSYSGATLGGCSTEPGMICDPGLENWRHKWASLCREGSLALWAPMGSVVWGLETYGNSEDLQGHGLGGGGLTCARMGTSKPQSMPYFLKLVGRIWFVRNVLSFREWGGVQSGWTRLRHTVQGKVFWKFLCTMTCTYLLCF